MRSLGSRPWLAGLALCALAGCYKNIPPVLAPERPVLEVAASFDATWTAVIDLFAEQHIGIQLLDKPSGLIVAVPFEVPPDSAVLWASCGGFKRGIEPEVIFLVTHAEYNIRVRARAPGSTIRVTAKWITRNPEGADRPKEAVCETTNVWESEFEALVRAAAQRVPGL
jgi:hypothetical protein